TRFSRDWSSDVCSSDLTRVLHEPVAVAIAAALDPRERALDVGPDGLDQLAIARALVIGAGEHDEQRRRVHGTVIAPERHLAEGRSEERRVGKEGRARRA